MAAMADPVAFGARQFNIPAPEGFVPVAARAPRYLEAAQGFLPPSNRLVESYVTEPVAQSLAKSTPVTIARYFQLQTMRKVDGTPLATADFAAARDQIETSFAKVIESLDVDKLARDGNSKVKELTANDPRISLSGATSQGVYRREPWAIFFTVKTHVTSGDGDQGDLIGAGALALINHQLMYLNGYANLGSDEDRRWVQQAVSSWADMVHAANPDDPAVAAQAQPPGPDMGQVGKTILLGALGGALIGLVVALARRGKS